MEGQRCLEGVKVKPQTPESRRIGLKAYSVLRCRLDVYQGSKIRKVSVCLRGPKHDTTKDTCRVM